LAESIGGDLALTDQTLSQASVQDHLAIIAAIRDRDVERLVTVAVNHIQPAVDVYRRIYGLT
jgi:DNA-binding GntR family transcriptional regulator